VIFPLAGYSQYANDWIVQGQQYFRIPVSKKGIYRLTHADLQAAGVPVSSIDPRLIQVYHRGVEQSIFVQGQADSEFNTSDYLEFFGQANDGTLDKNLYKPSSFQPHNYYNLYSDTTAYFLTWRLAPIPGKRVTANTEINVSGLPKEVYHNEQRLLVNKNDYATGNKESDVIQFTHFDEGEGWTGTGLQQNQSVEYTLDLITNGVMPSGNPQLEVLLVGRDVIPHSAEIFAGQSPGSLRSLGTQAFSGFGTVLLTYTLNWSDIGADGRMVVRLTAGPDVTNRFQFSASYLKVTFPQNFQSSGATEKMFYIKPSASSPFKSYIELDNAPTNLRIWDVTDPANITSLRTEVAGSALTAMVPSTQQARTLYAFNTISTPSLKRISFRTIEPTVPDFIVITHRQLRQPTGSYADPVKAYAGYRASAEGGGYDTLLVNMDQLYHQFNYGETSPLAIYEFMRYMVGEGDPKYLFLIGKGREVSSGFHRITNPSASITKDLVPSAGLPASDMAFTAGLNGTTYEPAVPTGRLPATTSAEVAAYLNKVKELESATTVQTWMKKGLHLSGGIQPGELITFREYLDEFKQTGEGAFWGGSFATIGKRESNPVELINISDQVNAGVNLVTFFGHSSPSTIDIDIGFASNTTLGYNNPGKYPVFLINGCNAGNFFANSPAFGEDWILTSNKGARNFIAHSSFGFVSSLRYYSELFYEIGLANQAFINKGVGDVQKEVARQFMQSAPAIMSYITQVQQMVLLGDPAVKLFKYEKPDYEITSSSLSLISYNDKPINMASDSFALRVVVKNLGLATTASLRVKVARSLSDGSQIIKVSNFPPVLNQDTLLITMYREAAGAGNNQFTVTLDPDGQIDELNEGNNEAVLSEFIASNATVNLFPKAYTIVSASTAKLTWQTADLLSGTRIFDIEVDTTNQFNSQFLIRRSVTAKVLASTTINLLARDSTVYFWRTRFQTPGSNESGDWTTSSFAFIANGSEGWAQLRKAQLTENSFAGLIGTNEGVPFEFEETSVHVSVRTFGNASGLPYTDVSIKINDSEYNLGTQGQPCRNNTINMVAFNKTTVVPYAGIPFNFQDPRTCGREPQLINSFDLSELETGLGDDLAAFVQNVGVSDSVVLFSIGDPGYTSWSANVKATLGQLGIGLAELNALQAGEPVIIFARKGAAPGTARVVKTLVAPANQQLITETEDLTGRRTNGEIKSVLIGPAAEWHRFLSRARAREAEDELSFSIYGVALSGTETLLTGTAGFDFDLSTVSADDYPYLRIVFNTEDEINLTPADWRKWAVLYEPVAEGVLVWKGPEGQQNLQEGEPWSSRFGFVNISDKNFQGPLLVNQDVLTLTTQHHQVIDFQIDAPVPGDTTFFTVSSSMLGKTGMNDVNIFVNRRIQPEQYYDNNFIRLPSYLNVINDDISPLLEVTFDGKEIRNGEYVSSSPVITLTIKDENRFLLKTDTLGVTLLFKKPCQFCDFKRIVLRGNDVKWFPATATSDFKVEFTPGLLPDGEYSLSAQGMDAKGNFSGDTPYLVSFNVKAETTIQFKSVYPNPSAMGFFFGFELTGNTLPDNFMLEIYSPEGQRVRTFTHEDIRQFHIGNNQLFWDGASSSGNPLPAGLYIYRLQVGVGSNAQITQGKLAWMR